MEEESIKIPRKVRGVVGPSSLLGARGMPKLEATWIMVLTLLAQTPYRVFEIIEFLKLKLRREMSIKIKTFFAD